MATEDRGPPLPPPEGRRAGRHRREANAGVSAAAGHIPLAGPPCAAFHPIGASELLATIFDRLKEKLGERYELERELGSGGMATVFLAKDLRHEREVAIKVLHPELSASIGAERFEREIKLAARLQHPNILGLYDSGAADGLLYYVMPFIKGESLRDRIDRETQLPIDDAIQITLEVAEALGHAHAAGIVHRDIKPENILISGGHALVADFGIARAASEAGGHKLTQTGMAVGTPVYMSPEQAVGDPVGPTSDLYSLGCMLYEMLAGEPPFTARNAQALMARHSMEAVPSVRIVRNTVPEEVEDAIFAAMAKVPADRPQTAAQFMELLGLPMGATASRRTSIRHTASRRLPTGATRAYEEPTPWWGTRWALGGGAVLLASLAVAGWLAFAGSGGGSGIADLARARQLAILYFAAPPGDPELRSVADRITESVIRSLDGVPELVVRSAGAVAPLGNTFSDSVSAALNVGSVVTGTVEASGANRVRISTSLREAASGAPINSTSTEVTRDSLFTAEDAVVSEVARSLKQVIGREINLRESRSRSSNLAAWTALQRAEKLRKDAGVAGHDNPRKAMELLASADSLLQQAAAADVRWIEPLILRGDLALARARLEDQPAAKQKWYEEGLGHADAALKLDPRSGKALQLRGTLQFAEWSLDNSPNAAARQALLEGAEQDLLGAVTADPGLAVAFLTLSSLYFYKQDLTEAHNQAAKAYIADRYLANADFVLQRLFYTAYDTRSFAQATKWCDEGAIRFPRNYEFTICRLWLMLTPDVPPDIRTAWQLAARVDSLAPSSERLVQSHLARLIVGGAIGKMSGGVPSPLVDSARHVLDRARLTSREDPKHELDGYEAVSRIRIGDYPEALRLLTRYVASNPDHSFRVGGDVHWWWEPLLQMPEFQRLLAAQRR